MRWQSAATTPLSDCEWSFQSGVALRFPPQSKIVNGLPVTHELRGTFLECAGKAKRRRRFRKAWGMRWSDPYSQSGVALHLPPKSAGAAWARLIFAGLLTFVDAPFSSS
jgi:hypothetical protein